jgi:hypothetical protein
MSFGFLEDDFGGKKRQLKENIQTELTRKWIREGCVKMIDPQIDRL